MKWPITNKKPVFALATALVLLLGALLIFMWQAKKGKGAPKAAGTEIEGVNLTYLTFNKSNEKKLEVRCLETQKKTDEKLYMKKITATIFKADKLEKDIHISADSGVTQDDFNDFYIQGNALISSPSFTLSSNSFRLKNLDALTSQDGVAFKLDKVSGRAEKGISYLIVNKVMNMLQTKGVLIRDGNSYDFQARTLRVNEKKKLLLLVTGAQVDGAGTTVKADRIAMQFDQDFAILQTATARGSSYFHGRTQREDGRMLDREITAEQIQLLHDPQGRLQQMRINGQGRMAQAVEGDSGWIESDAMEVIFNPETQILESLRTMAPGTLVSQGKNNIKVSAGTLQTFYDKDGALSKVTAEGRCEFSTDDFSGNAARLDHDAANALIKISGKNTEIVSKKNTFNSSQFLLKTKLRQLSSDKGVKATLIPDKKSVLLSAKPVFVTSTEMETSEKGDVTRFRDKVKLFQDEVELQAGELIFDSRGNRISCRNNADLKFLDGDELVFLHGRTILFHGQELKITIEGEARLRQGDNALAAQRIELAFSRNDRLETISASGGAEFSRKDLSGTAQLLSWQYARKTVLFKKAASITRKESGTTRGEELLFNLETNEITVSGSGDRSETTIRQELP